MMYAFYRNLCNILLFMLVFALCLAFACTGNAATNAPRTGLEGGQGNSFGPGSENKQNKGIPTGGAMVDAYGNPVVPEEEQVTPRERLRSGAYGGANKQNSRPLPDLPETDAGWKFK